MQKDAAKYVKKCDQCQKHSSNIHQPGRNLNSISNSWPFTQWGLDIVGSFPYATSNKRFAIVATDFFMKWVEEEAIANIQDVDMKKFGCTNIIIRFGIPKMQILDNGLWFDSKAFQKCCNDLKIKNRYLTPTYPPYNGQAEATNKTIIYELKKMIEGAKR